MEIRSQTPAHSMAEAAAASTSTKQVKTMSISGAKEASPPTPDGDSDTDGSKPTDHTTTPVAIPTTLPGCSLDIEELTKQYAEDMQSAKDELDKKLSFPTGISISSQFVDTYNKKVSGLYDRYDAKAETAGCSFTPAKPTPLPSTYLGL